MKGSEWRDPCGWIQADGSELRYPSRGIRTEKSEYNDSSGMIQAEGSERRYPSRGIRADGFERSDPTGGIRVKDISGRIRVICSDRKDLR